MIQPVSSVVWIHVAEYLPENITMHGDKLEFVKSCLRDKMGSILHRLLQLHTAIHKSDRKTLKNITSLSATLLRLH